MTNLMKAITSRYKVYEYTRVRSMFTYYLRPYYTGLIVGFFDFLRGSLCREDLNLIISMLRMSKLREKVNRSYVNIIFPERLEVVEYGGYVIVVYETGSKILMNGVEVIESKGSALKKYIKDINGILMDHITTQSDLYKICNENPRIDRMDYLYGLYRLFGEEMWSRNGQIYAKLYDDMDYRGFICAAKRARAEGRKLPKRNEIIEIGRIKIRRMLRDTRKINIFTV